MFKILLDPGLCNGVKRCDTRSSEQHTYISKYEGADVRTLHGSDDHDEYLISRSDIENSLAHQYWVEQRMEERQHGPLRRSMSDATSVLSSPASSTTSSYASNVFSAITEVIGNDNKYVPASSSPKHKQGKSPRGTGTGTGSSPSRKSRDRYQITHSSIPEDDDDWDYLMDKKIGEKYDLKATPKHEYVLHLKMIARMSDFYRDEFLLSFPQYPVPKEMSMRKVSFQSNWGKGKASRQSTSRSPPKVVRSNSCTSSACFQDSEADDSDASPVLLAVDESSFLDIVVHGSLGLVDNKRSSSASGKARRKLKDYLIIGKRQTDCPLLVCALKSRKGKPVVRIFSAKPRTPLQEASIESDKLGITTDSYPLYAWAELRTEGSFPDANTKYFLHESTGDINQFHKTPLFTASHESAGSTELNIFVQRVVGKGYSKDPLHCARSVVRSDSKMCEQETNYMISIVKGVDFANILSMVAIIDELTEFTMRKKCAMQAWKFASSGEDV